MPFEVRFDSSRLKKRLERLGAAAHAQVNALMAFTAEEARNYILIQIKKSPTGAPYKRHNGGKGGKYRYGNASIPGNFPRRDRGQLSSHFHVRTGNNFASVVNNVGYARYLDEGTRHMAARPMAKPTSDKFGPILQKRIKAMLRKLLGKKQ